MTDPAGNLALDVVIETTVIIDETDERSWHRRRVHVKTYAAEAASCAWPRQPEKDSPCKP